MESSLDSLDKGALELVKLRDEILHERELKSAGVKKALAEAEKIRADAHGTKDSLVHLWKKPTAWAAILPGLAALLTASYGAYNGYFTKYFDTQKELLDAKVEMLKADTTKLEAQKMLLEGQLQLKQDRLKDEQERLDRKREEFAKEKAIYDKHIADLQSEKAAFDKQIADLQSEKATYNKQIANLQTEAAQLAQRSKRLPVELPLNALLSADVRNAEFGLNENYQLILNGLKNDPDAESMRENAALVSASAATVKSPMVQALLYRTVYIATGDKAALANMKSIVVNRWTEMARLDPIFFYDGGAWPDDVRRDLFSLMLGIAAEANVRRKIQAMFSAVKALSYLCGWRCLGVGDSTLKLKAATQARDALVAGNPMDSYEADYSNLLIFDINPFAGRLVFAKLWKDDKISRFPDHVVKEILGDRDLPDGKNRPASADKAAWLKWLEQNKAKFDIVWQQPAEAWPKS